MNKKGLWIWVAVGLIFSSLILVAYLDFNVLKEDAYRGNVKVPFWMPGRFLYVRTGSDLAGLNENLSKNNLLRDSISFMQAVVKAGYQNIKPGKYLLKWGMTDAELVNILKEGKSEMCDLMIHKIRFKEEFAALVSHNLEPDSAGIMKLLEDDDYLLQNFGFNCDNIMAMFVANKYRFKWNISGPELLRRLKMESDKVWNYNRRARADSLHLHPSQVMSLAAIVQEETMHKDEAPKIAGVYLNRLRDGISLFADPTLKYLKMQVNKDEDVHRIYDKFKDIESPYNTYKNKGLPPGPIVATELWAIDAVLHPEHHNYIFFVARDDFKGYHHFSVDFMEHKEWAKKYRKGLDERGIK